MLTVITMYRGTDAEFFTQIVEGRLTPEQRRTWRDAHKCDLPGDEDEEDVNNMFFREFETPVPNDQTADMLNADQETYTELKDATGLRKVLADAQEHQKKDWPTPKI